MEGGFAMKTTILLLTAALGLSVSVPIAAHHNCNAGDEVCPEEIGDVMGYHELAYDALDDNMVGSGAMSVEDPADVDAVVGGDGRTGETAGTANRDPRP
jgi:hypothetical protein